ncbi:ATP-binding protein [Caldithrix abyssi]
MKLKYKILFSYLFLILLFSVALLGLLFEIKQISASIKDHARHDIKSIIYLSQQLQELETLNANYILIFIPSNTSQKIINLERARQKFSASWEKVKSNLKQSSSAKDFNRWPKKILKAVLHVNLLQTDSVSYRLIRQTDNKWLELDRNIKKSVEFIRKRDFKSARYLRETHVLSALKSLRQDLIQLNRQIGNQSIQRTLTMARIVENIQSSILLIELGLLFVSLLTAFFIARKITRPIEALKDGIQRMAIQDFSLSIPNKPNDEIGELSSAFEELSLHLKEADRFKSAILSQFTHEMKSPLGSIKQATLLLENSLKDQMNPTQKRFLEIIKGNYQTLQSLITTILQSASYDLGNIQLKYQRINVVKVVTELLINLSPVIKEKELKVNINFSSKTIEAELDVEKFKEVVQNLLSNAVKFSDRGKAIEVKLSERFALIRLSVKDQGIGIPEKEIPYIFEKMYRASNSEKISVKGTGLGLYIASQIVRAHGGQIKVKSVLGRGSVFTVILPKNRRIAEEGGWLNG